ncbi:mariner Mos1 transposase [Trichonephila clavipes]|nr:mariner Mos1 transposase [Trichonephila clavipes]
MLCIWWYLTGTVYYEHLNPSETFNTQRYRQEMINLNPALIERRLKWANSYVKGILLHGNAPSHIAKPVKETLKSLGWDLLLSCRKPQT